MTVERLREYLDRLSPLLTQRELLEGRLERLHDRATSPRRAQLTGMPSARSTTDQTGGLAVSITDTERKLAALSAEIDRIQDETAAVLDLMPPAKKRNHYLQEGALWGRYIEAMSTRDLAKSLYGKKKDFDSRQETYIRQASRQVLEGLKRLAPLVPDEMIDNIDQHGRKQ